MVGRHKKSPLRLWETFSGTVGGSADEPVADFVESDEEEFVFLFTAENKSVIFRFAIVTLEPYTLTLQGFYYYFSKKIFDRMETIAVRITGGNLVTIAKLTH